MNSPGKVRQRIRRAASTRIHSEPDFIDLDTPAFTPRTVAP
jgi:hypothetical protein